MLGSAQTRQGQALDLIRKVKGLGPLRVWAEPNLILLPSVLAL